MTTHAAASRRKFGLIQPRDAQHMSGLEFLQAIQPDDLPSPPMAQALDFELVEVERGRAEFSGHPDARFYNPIGSVHGGYAATLLDSAMGVAVHSMLEASQGYTTVEIKINYVRPITETTGTVRAEANVVSFGKRLATAESKLTDVRGKLLAHGTTTCMVL
jgi:uncharacterized protein (TIGR00369 family)